MNTVKDNYELHILSKAINNCIDKTLPVEANKALHLILHQNDDLVWEIATSIFRISGHKVDLSLVRDLANSRIESLKIIVAKQVQHEAKEQAKKEAIKIEEAHQKAINKAKEKAELQPYALKVFDKLKQIIAEKLEVEVSRVILDSDIMKDLGADELDSVELAMAIEEEFDLEEIPYDISLCNIRNLLNFVCSNLKMHT
jgi:acyl carrier protein